MIDLGSLNVAVQQFEQAVTGGDFKKSKQLQESLKLDILDLSIYDRSNPQSVPREDEVLIARSFSESNLRLNILTLGEDTSELEFAINNIRLFYENFQTITRSTYQSQLIASYLLFYLSFNQITNFHTAIELIDLKDLKDEAINFVIEIQRSISEGNYNKVYDAKNKSQSKLFDVFLNRILETIRFEQARSAEQAFTSLKVDEAIKIFRLNNINQLKDYIKNNENTAHENGYRWRIDSNTLLFESVQKLPNLTNQTIT